MEDGGKAAAQQQQLMQQQQLLLQQMQRQRDAISRFPSNIDAHLRPLLHSSSRPTNPSPPHPPQQQQQQQQQMVGHHHPNPSSSSSAAAATASINNSGNTQQQQQHQHKASLQMAYQDAWRVCHPDYKRPFSSLEDACERLLPYHVVADYEAEEDDKILDSDTTGQILSRSQQWDHNIAAKVAEFTATFEKQVLAFNIISHKRGLGEFRTEEKLMMEQLQLQDEKRALLELRAEMESRQKAASRETQEVNMRMAAMAAQVEQARAESQAHTEMMARGPIRSSALGSRGSSMSVGADMGEQEQDVPQDDVMNGWGGNAQKDDKEPSEDFLNDDETENGDTGMQSEWHGGGEFDLNAR